MWKQDCKSIGKGELGVGDRILVYNEINSNSSVGTAIPWCQVCGKGSGETYWAGENLLTAKTENWAQKTFLQEPFAQRAEQFVRSAPATSMACHTSNQGKINGFPHESD